MPLLKKSQFVCLDCEFTGLDFENDRVIEIAAARFTFDGIIEEYDQLVDPEHPISKDALRVHNISEEMLQGKPKIADVLPAFFNFVGKDRIVGHMIGGDIKMLTKEAERAGIPCPLKEENCVDTLRLARHYGDSPSNSLETLARHFNVPFDKTHRALDDVQINITVFKRLVERYSTLEQILKILDRPIEMKYMPLGKHKGRFFSEIPLSYLKWAAHMDFDMDLLYSIRKEINKRKKGGGFAQASNPFSEL
ncbi:MAG: DUF3820 family protein [Chlamydiales bacterium]|nr:DUF3820 family protein [Chlamydiales bacterium]